MTSVYSIEEALKAIFAEKFEAIINNPKKILKIDLQNFVFKGEVNDTDILSTFSELRYLNISGTSISNIVPLMALKKLEILYADFCKISDITPLSNLINLREIDLSAPMDCIHTIEPFKNLIKLEKLYIPDHPIKTIKPLYNLDQLKILSVARTDIPEKEIKEFKELQPNCEIWY